MTLHTRLGLRLAQFALWATGNPRLSRCVSSLPLIPARRLLISAEPVDESSSSLIQDPGWLVYDHRKKIKRTRENDRQIGVSRTEILRTNLSPLMAIEGSCILEAWLKDDFEFLDHSLQDIVSQIYAAMEIARSRQTTHDSGRTTEKFEPYPFRPAAKR